MKFPFSVSRQTQGIIATIHAVATWFMVGLIWTIHVLNYPQRGTAGKLTYQTDSESIYDALQSEHVDKIGKLLIVPWLTEGMTLIAILAIAFLGPNPKLRVAAVINAAAMSVVLLISGIWSAPAHGKLLDGFDPDVYDTLMAANLVRTIAWTICGIAAILILRDLREERDSDSAV